MPKASTEGSDHPRSRENHKTPPREMKRCRFGRTERPQKLGTSHAQGSRTLKEVERLRGSRMLTRKQNAREEAERSRESRTLAKKQSAHEEAER
ncbi:hypothetical protein SESBI_33027 [Sesbania bispinosa]|nr:hypothetical protein SESBI_33027 [Sesbania bispinosa]